MLRARETRDGMQLNGEFVFSVDVEMEVGAKEKRHGHGSAKNPGRKEVSHILDAAEKYAIPVTFGVVGHLFLESCSRHSPVLEFALKKDPHEYYPKDKGHYARDIVEKIRDRGLHEIACHTFSHYPFKYAPRGLVEADLAECVKAAGKEGIRMRTLIFPRNRIGHLGLLRKFGFTHFTSNPKTKFFFLNYRSLSLSLPRPHFRKQYGLMEVPRTFYLDRVEKRDLLKLWATMQWARMQNEVVHIWTHPWNLKDHKYITQLERIFEMADSIGLAKKTVSQVVE